MGSKETSKGKFCKLNLAVFYLLVVCVCTSHAVEEERPALRDRPSLSIVVHQVQHSVTASFDVDVILTNLTNNAFDVSQVKVLLPESVKGLRDDTPKETLRDTTHELAAGSERIYRLHIPTVHRPLLKSILDFETLFFAPGKYFIMAEVEFKPIGTGSKQSMHQTYELTLDPPLSAPLRGGVLGALLLAVFVPAYGALYNKRGTKRPKAGDLLVQGLTYLIAGSVIAITAILLLHRLGNLELPITVAVNDYLGGMVIGLFSYKIGDALYKQFFS